MYVLLSDPSGTGAASASLMATVTHWITTYGVPMILGIMFVGVVVLILIRFAKRAIVQGWPVYISDEERSRHEYDDSFFEDG